MKNIIKFILKMAVTLAIVIGIVFGAIAIFNPKSNKDSILKLATEKNISQNITSLIGDKSSISELAFLNSEYTSDHLDKVNGDRVVACNKVNKVLVEYYDYYISLTTFENYTDNNSKKEIENKIKELATKIDSTKKYYDFAKTSLEISPTELNGRLKYAVDAYNSQTKCFIELNELLKNYVEKVVYNKNTYNYIAEAQLEMMKDYSSVAFNYAISGHMYSEATKDNMIITDSGKTSFNKVYEKFQNRSSTNKNDLIEMKFFTNYRLIENKYLENFYKTKDKLNFTNTETNYMPTAPENETPEEKTLREAKGETQRQSIIMLFDYLSRESF